MKVINKPCPAPFQESIKFAEQNLLARAKELVGDRDPRDHEFMVQLRAFDAAKSGAGLGVPALLALAGALLEQESAGRPDRGRQHQPGRHDRPGLQRCQRCRSWRLRRARRCADARQRAKAAQRPVDDMATKVDVVYYADARDALLKAVVE